jgi:hypothetical protein
MKFSSGSWPSFDDSYNASAQFLGKVAGEWASSKPNACGIAVVAVKHQRPGLNMKFPLHFHTSANDPTTHSQSRTPV